LNWCNPKNPAGTDKPANQLQDWEKTLYYERMMFVIEVPSIMDTIDGNTLSITLLKHYEAVEMKAQPIKAIDSFY
jgi:hypothetical protein